MFMAPVLAVVLALLLTGSIYYSPLPTTQSEAQLQAQASPQLTQTPEPTLDSASTTQPPTVTSTEKPAGDSQPTVPSTPAPTTVRSDPIPSAIPSTGADYQVTASTEPENAFGQTAALDLTPILFGLAALVVAVLVVCLFFSEKSLNKDA